MTFGELLNMTCTIYRRSPSAVGDPDRDRFGQPYKVDRFRQPEAQDDVVASGVKCRIRMPSGGEVMAERSHDVVSANTTLYLESAVDIREQDAVTVWGPDGRQLTERAEVKMVKPVYGFAPLHHLEVSLTEQREASGITREEAGV